MDALPSPQFVTQSVRPGHCLSKHSRIDYNIIAGFLYCIIHRSRLLTTGATNMALTESDIFNCPAQTVTKYGNSMELTGQYSVQAREGGRVSHVLYNTVSRADKSAKPPDCSHDAFAACSSTESCTNRLIHWLAADPTSEYSKCSSRCSMQY